MASTETGELYTQVQYDKMPIAERDQLGIVNISPEESRLLSGMNRRQRREWLRANKKLKRVRP